jgi:hypothetical protein
MIGMKLIQFSKKRDEVMSRAGKTLVGAWAETETQKEAEEDVVEAAG